MLIHAFMRDDRNTVGSAASHHDGVKHMRPTERMNRPGHLGASWQPVRLKPAGVGTVRCLSPPRARDRHALYGGRRDGGAYEKEASSSAETSSATRM
jgi:hypothetical protein